MTKHVAEDLSAPTLYEDMLKLRTEIGKLGARGEEWKARAEKAETEIEKLRADVEAKNDA